jgi:uncharacterized OB-fold protein
MPDVKSKKDILQIEAGEDSLWADFGQVERLTLSLTQTYTHTLGRYSRFFIELENQRFMATRCGRCQRVYAPPRPLCPDCLCPTYWVELAGTGTVQTFSVQHFSPGSNADVAALKTPYVFAYVLLDGASTLFPHLLIADPAQVTVGMRVRVHYVQQPVEHPIHLIHFIPVE